LDLFLTEGENKSTVNQISLKIAELKTLPEGGDYVGAIKIYEKVADNYLENKLTSGSARDLFFRCCLLNLVLGDTVGAMNSVDRYIDKDPSLSSTKEFKFIRNLTQAIEEKKIQEFSDACFDFNAVMPLDRWKTTILNRIKAALEKSIKDVFQVAWYLMNTLFVWLILILFIYNFSFSTSIDSILASIKYFNV